MNEPAAARPEASGEPLRLMLVEDDRDYAWLVEEMLRDTFGAQPFEVSSYGSMREAVESAVVPDLAIVDLSLPDGRGLEVLDAVQAAMPAVPLIVLTGAEDEELALQAVERGAQDYLVKRRVDPDVLGRSIRYSIERSRAERQRAELLQARAAHAEAEALSSTLERLQAVADAAIVGQGGRVNHDELLERSLQVIAADAGALILRDRATGDSSAVACRGIAHLTSETPLDADGATAAVIAADGPLLLNDIPGDDAGPLGAHGEVRSLVAVPLEADGTFIGAIVATSGLPDRFSDEQARLLALAAERVARGLAAAAAYERERRTAATLQTGLLPQAVPAIDDGEIAVRYLPARDGPEIGGDWYDAIVLPDGRVGLAIGDVTGHGAEAAVLMGQLRTALRAYALEGTPPAQLAARLNALAISLGDSAMATLVYALLDPGLTSGRYVNAGHPQPIVVSRTGAAALNARASTPAGAAATAVFEEHDLQLEPGDALCLYSDGLIEDRGTDMAERELVLIEALGQAAGAEVLCERALAALRPEGAARDDVALLVLRTSATADELKSVHPATPDALGDARAALREWLTEIGATRSEVSDIQMACNEACMNVVEHAYPDGRGEFVVEGYLDEQTVVIIVRDHGRWSEVQSRDRGRGLKLMEALMNSVQLSFSAEGTVVVLRRTIGSEPA